jgi:hypothetical protein
VLPIGGGQTQWFCVSGEELNDAGGSCLGYDKLLPALGCENTSVCVLELTVKDFAGEVQSRHVVLLVAPARLQVGRAKVTAEVAGDLNADGSINVILRASDAVALYVTLTTTEQVTTFSVIFLTIGRSTTKR